MAAMYGVIPMSTELEEVFLSVLSKSKWLFCQYAFGFALAQVQKIGKDLPVALSSVL